MNEEMELYEIDVAEWLRETDKAWQVRTTVGTVHWIAKSQITERGDDYLLIPMWLAERSRVAQHIEAASQTAAA